MYLKIDYQYLQLYLKICAERYRDCTRLRKWMFHCQSYIYSCLFDIPIIRNFNCLAIHNISISNGAVFIPINIICTSTKYAWSSRGRKKAYTFLFHNSDRIRINMASLYTHENFNYIETTRGNIFVRLWSNQRYAHDMST